MPDRLALKRLTASDLTFFETLFRALNVGNQKSINLNADVFIERFYPNLPELTPIPDVIPVSLTIFGPAGGSAYTLSRAITKREAYKNWRLNGEFVRDPEGQQKRFDAMKAGDLAVMEFIGDPAPQKVSLLLISAGSAADAALHGALNPHIPGGRRTMVQITRAELAQAANGVSPSHPVWLLAEDTEFDAALEDAALGGVEGTKSLATKKAKKVTAAALAAAKISAEKNGRDGEALAWVYLKKVQADGKVKSIEWASETNAVAPYDFIVVEADGTTVNIDAKSTNGEFSRPIHMSGSELIAAASTARYDLWRIYKIDDNGARLRVASSIAPQAKTILAGFTLPKGVTVDGVSIDPQTLSWSKEVEIERPDESED